MSNRVDQLFRAKASNILSVYFTAGSPQVNNTVEIIQLLQASGCDMIEIGIPFSDPLADGPVIQASSTKALENGMTLKLLFEQLKNIRNSVNIPLILMGYFNPVFQYGIEKFCADAAKVGIDGIIIPDLPVEMYSKDYAQTFAGHGLHNILLITPATAQSRIREMEKWGSGFIYAVASASTTGASTSDKNVQQPYFERIKAMKPRLPVMAGFGIANRTQFQWVCNYLQGGIIGTAFIRHIEQNPDLKTSIPSFIQSILYDSATGK